MIEIGTKKTSEHGKEFREITRLKALGLDDLPDQYFSGYPVTYLKRNGELVILPDRNSCRIVWVVGERIDEVLFQRQVLVIRASGMRLRAIKQGEKKPAWRGRETIRI